jgi:3-oxoacyl-[acyl-carrier protein] reductase
MADRDSRTALVTGASGGIGRVAALRLARDGFAVVINYAGNPATAQTVCTEIVSGGGRARVAQADVASAPDVRRIGLGDLLTVHLQLPEHQHAPA